METFYAFKVFEVQKYNGTQFDGKDPCGHCPSYIFDPGDDDCSNCARAKKYLLINDKKVYPRDGDFIIYGLNGEKIICDKGRLEEEYILEFKR